MAGTKMFSHEFVVEGTFSFPTDMLRYDHCYPAGQDDVSKILDKAPRGEKMRVKLAARAEKAWRPTEGRWRSFGWHVLDKEHRIW